MFDLFRSRAKAVRYLLGGLLMLVALSMVVTLIPGYGTGGGSNDTVVAEIGDSVLTVRDVQQRLQMIMRSRNIPREMQDSYSQQVIDGMLTEKMMLYEAERLGLTVSNDELARGIRALAPQLFQNGQFVGKDVYAQFLSQQNLTIPEFESSIRTEMLIAKLTNLAAMSVTVTPAEIEREYQRRNEKIKLDYVSFSSASFAGDARVTPDELRREYEMRKASYRVPEQRDLQLLVVDEAKIAARIPTDEAALRKFYDANRESFRVPEQAHARHILLKTQGKPKEEVAKIQAKAEDLLKQIKAGANFAELAKKYSEDPGSASQGGDLGFFGRGQMVPNFEKATFALKPNEISGVVPTEYGFHIVQMLEHQEPHVKSFEEAKGQIAQQLQKQQVVDTVQKLADQAHDLLVKSPSSAPQIAAQLGIDVITAEKIAPGQPVPEFGANPDFASAITGLPKGGVTPVMQAPGNKLGVAVVTAIIPARVADFSEVEGRLSAEMSARKLQTVVEQKAAEFARRAKEANGDLRKVAQTMGLEVKTTQEFARDGAADGIGPAASLAGAFEQPVDSIYGPVSVSGDTRFVCKVVSKSQTDMSKLAEQRDSIVSGLKSNKARERAQLFQDSVRAALIRDKKVKLHQDVIRRMMESNRG